jgi:hypothetical protein
MLITHPYHAYDDCRSAGLGYVGVIFNVRVRGLAPAAAGSG